MAVVNTKSAAVTNSDAATQTQNKMITDRGRLRETVGTIEVANGDSIASTLRIARIRSSDRVSRVMLSCDAIATAVADIGIWRTAADGGAVVNLQFFASLQALTAALVNLDVTHEADPADASTGFGLQDVEKPMWLALGLTTDPMVFYDVVLQLTAAATGAGTVSLKIQYNAGD